MTANEVVQRMISWEGIMERISGIYKITNRRNNLCYIGKSVNIYQRWNAHRTHYLNPKSPDYNKALYQSFREYGIENFIFEIIEAPVESDQLNEREKYWIQYYNSCDMGYNRTNGGDGVVNNSGERHPNHKLTKEDVELIRTRWAACKESTKEIYEDYKDKIAKTGFKKIYSWQTWKQIMPELNTQERRDWHRNNVSNYGHPGEKNNTAILSDAQVREIRTRYKNGESVKDIFNDYASTGITFGSFRNTTYGYNRKYIVS